MKHTNMPMLSNIVLITVVLVGNRLAAAEQMNLRIDVCIERKISCLERVSVLHKNTGCKIVELRSQQLVLDRLDISSFKSGWYKLTDNDGVSVISLDYNKIINVTRNVVNDLPASIVTLHLSRNRIKCLEEETFRHKGITGLILRGNEISEIKDNAFRTPNLTHLNLLANQIKDTKFAATLPSNVESLELGANMITEITVDSFDHLKNLMYLDLADNRITVVEPGVLNSTKLRDLNLSNNNIHRLEVNFFDDLPELQRLDISGNKLRTIENNAYNLPNLKFMDTSNDDINVIGNGDIKDLRRPMEVDSTKKPAWTTRIEACVWMGIVHRVRIFNEAAIRSGLCEKVTVSSIGHLELSVLDLSGFKRGWYALPDNNYVSGISLDHNRIVNVTKNIVTGIPVGITFLDLSGNAIERLEKGSMKHNGIRYLTLYNNRISQIDASAFETPNLSHLSLSENRLKDTEFVATLPSNIEWLALRSNEITEITEHSFDSLKKLIFLDLDDNKITTIGPGRLNFPNVRDLVLSNNHISSLGDQVLTELQELRRLDLSGNELTIIKDKIFNLPNLNVLNMSKNNIEVIGKEVFGNLNCLTTIDLTYNPMTVPRVQACINDEIIHLITFLDNNTIRDNLCEEVIVSSFGEMDLRGMGVSGFEKGWYCLPDNDHVFEISFANNTIVHVTKNIVNNLPAGIVLVDLYGNQIERLKKGTFRHSGIRYLTISYNFINHIEDNCFETPNLARLSLLSNRLEDTKFIETLPLNIVVLELGSNKITKVTANTFDNLEKLIYLGLDNNKIRKIEPAAFILPNLRELVLSNNRLLGLDEEVFTNLPELQRLDISRNKLLILEINTFVLPKLNFLNLSNNDIGYIQGGAFVSVSSTIDLDLRNNPIREIPYGIFAGLPENS